MASSKYIEMTSLYKNHLANLTSSTDGWQSFLKSASHNYKCSFDELVQINAQRPDATAVLEYDRWKSVFRRWVNHGSKGIGILQDNGKLKYYFDVSDTSGDNLSKPLPLWKLDSSDYEPINELISVDNISASSDLASTLNEMAKDTLNEVYPNVVSAVREQYAGSSLETMDVVTFIEGCYSLLHSSILTCISTRLEMPLTAPPINEDILSSFDTPELVNTLGCLCTNISSDILNKVHTATIVQKNVQEQDYNTTTIEERIDDNGIDIQRGKRSANTEHQRTRTGGSPPRLLRTGEDGIPERTPSRDLHHDEDGLHIEDAPGRHGQTGNEVRGTSNQGDGIASGSERADETRRPNAVGGTNEQLQERSERVRSERTDLHLSDDTTSSNYRITDNDLGVGTPRQKFQNNILAIQTLQLIEKESRKATPEEQDTLAKYVGWGGLSDAFDPNKESWSKEYQTLKELLTDSEFTAARASTLTSFYTPPVVAQSIYTVLNNLGLNGGNILEPSCGTGNFLGLMPETMSSSKLYGVELDSLSGRMATQLYPLSNIQVTGFEKTTFDDNFFDAAIGNVPFGQFKVADTRYDKHGFSIHDYFFAKSLDKVRPGGVIAFITSSYTMDKKQSAVREYLSQRADLLGAIRLPNNTFKANAGTEVTSDILFLQKRESLSNTDASWLHINTDVKGIDMNQYFIDNPEMVLGQMDITSGPYGPETTCSPHTDKSLNDLLANAIKNINGTISEPVVELETNAADTSIPADPSVRNFSYTLVGDTVYFRKDSRMNEVETSAKGIERIKGLIEIRDTAKSLITAQLENQSDDIISNLQVRLNTQYDTFTAKNGLITSRGNSVAFSADSSYFLLTALEHLDKDGNLDRKADLFTKRTIRCAEVITHADTASEALAVSIAEKAAVDIPYMTELTGKTQAELVDELQGVIFHNPNFGFGNPAEAEFLPADEYLSGNVRQKLQVAKQQALLDPSFQVNVKALEQVQPTDLSASEISVRLGSTWVDPEYVKDFMVELLEPRYSLQSAMNVNYAHITGEWGLTYKNHDPHNIRANSTYGTSRINAYNIIEDTLNLKDVRIFDYHENADGKRVATLNKKETTLAQSKQELIKEKFVEWIWQDQERREKLCKKYNEQFNSTRTREYDGQHIQFHGMNPEIKLRPHQVNAIARTLYGGNTLLAHCVGAGKTYEMVAASMEAKRLGLCQKSMFVVPNHLTEQWASEFLQLYPAANILVTTKKDFEPKNRKRFCGRIATGNYDAVIIGHSQFEKIPMSTERQAAVIEKQISDVIVGIDHAKRNRSENFTIKQMEKTRKSLETKLSKLNLQEHKDDVVTFEELGVDRLFVDESHSYKNLFLYTKMRNVGGVAQTEAQKSSDLFMKCRYLDEITGGRGLVFATGTPISNSMVELYTIQRYLQMDTLEKQNLNHFDAWAATYGDTVTAIELAPEGTGYRSKTRFAKFNNLPELMTSFKNVADIQTADMLDLPVPKATYHNIAVQPSEHQKDLVESFVERAEVVRNRQVDSSVDNMLMITNDGRKVALDQRLINDLLPADPNSKSSICAGKVFEIWENTAAQKSAQMIFCDLSTPKCDGSFNVYDDIKNNLIEKGIPTDEIAFIHDAKTDVQKKVLFDKVRSGDVRVLIGSTQRMGAGTNAQDKLIALHHLDCPWRPSDLQQREGRIIRQGNENPNVDIFSYVTEQTFDAYLYQLVESKQKFISQIMTSKSPVRSAEDIDEVTLSYAEIKAIASGNPLIKEKMDLDIEVAKLKLLKSSYLSQRYSLEDQICKHIPEKIAAQTQKANGLSADRQHVTASTKLNQDGFSAMTLDSKTFTEKKDAGIELISICKNTSSVTPIPIGRYRGMDMELYWDSWNKCHCLTLIGTLRYPCPLGSDALGNIQRLDNLLATFQDKELSCLANVQELYTQLGNAQKDVQIPFDKEDDLKKALARLEVVDNELNIENKEDGSTPGTTSPQFEHTDMDYEP